MIYIKAFVCALVILAVLVSGFTINYMVLNNKSMVLTKKFEKLKTAIQNKDEQKINSSYEEIVHHWKKHNKYMLMFSNHSNLDSVSVGLIKIKEKIKSKKYSDAEEEIELALSSLSGIPQNETLRIENIF